MSAIGSGALPDARTIFEPLNAKKLERPAARNEPGIDYTPQCYGMLTWWSHVLVQKRGGELVEETNQGSKTFDQGAEWISYWSNIERAVWMELVHSATERCPREGIT